MCLKSKAYHKIDVSSKTQNGEAFVSICVQAGVHKLAYKCTVYSDGCGSMVHVAKAAVSIGLDHVYIPAHAQSLNEAEKLCDRGFAACRVMCIHTGCPPSLMYEMLSYYCHVCYYMATTSSRGWLTSYEICTGVRPSILSLRPFYTKTYVTVPKAKRGQLEAQGNIARAEVGRLLGYTSLRSSCAKVMLTGNRVVNSVNVTFDVTDYSTQFDEKHLEAPRPQNEMSADACSLQRSADVCRFL